MNSKQIEELVEKIEHSNVYDVAISTPTEYAAKLSKKLQHNVYLKREDLQPVFSFKLRGAYNKVVSLSEAEKKKGIVAVSAGNHAQGVALSAKKLGLVADIVMPTTTPQIKVEAVRDLGAVVHLVGDNYDDALEFAQNMVQETQKTFIPPYDDWGVIAGQGTVGKEIHQDILGQINAVFVPVGGGGLAAGVLTYLKSKRPDIKIIGVEPENSACLYHAIKAGKRVVLEQVGIFADGVSVKQIGDIPFQLMQHRIDDVILVDVDEICTSIKDTFEQTRTVVEPAGALALAGLKRYAKNQTQKDQTLVAINSGANVNFDRLMYIAERTALGESQEALLAVQIPEKKGSFKTFCAALENRAVTEFNYRYFSDEAAMVFVGIKLQEGVSEKEQLISKLQKSGYVVTDMSHNEMAKNHVRHMVGGKCSHIEDERLYRFEFPERPGALMSFLQKIGTQFNISLFHYRNHGAAFGRVLIGIQVPDSCMEEFESFLSIVEYRYFDESNNPAYTLFL